MRGDKDVIDFDRSSLDKRRGRTEFPDTMNEPVHSSQVRRAFMMARMMKWVFPLTPIFVLLIAVFTALLIKSSAPILVGFIIAIPGWIAAYFVGIQFCRCPQCGQCWWSPFSFGLGWLTLMMNAELGGDETDSFRCRTCGLEIGPHVRKGSPSGTDDRDAAAPQPDA